MFLTLNIDEYGNAIGGRIDNDFNRGNHMGLI